MQNAILFVAVLMLLGLLLRHSWHLLERLHIPASIVGGTIGLVLIRIAINSNIELVEEFSADLLDTLESWPGWLIAVVFAGMLLVKPKQQAGGQRFKNISQEGLIVWIIALGQTAVGLLVTWLLIQPYYKVPNSFAMLIETGFAGGHGTAAAMGQVFTLPEIGLADGRDLGIFMATGGLVYGVVSGVLLINLAIGRKWIDDPAQRETSLKVSETSNVETESHPSQPNDSALVLEPLVSWRIDPIQLAAIWLALAMLLGILLQLAMSGVAKYLDARFNTADQKISFDLLIGHYPLFIYTLLGGWFLRFGLTRMGVDALIEAKTVGRLTSIAMEILVVAAIAALNLQVVSVFFGPLCILLVAGAIWTAFCLLWLSPRILARSHWFELGLINYGMSTGTTATGFVLLAVVDPKASSGAAEDYALAVPLSSPFVGGGILTIGLPILLLERVPIAFSAIAAALVVTLLIWIAIRRR